MLVSMMVPGMGLATRTSGPCATAKKRVRIFFRTTKNTSFGASTLGPFFAWPSGWASFAAASRASLNCFTSFLVMTSSSPSEPPSLSREGESVPHTMAYQQKGGHTPWLSVSALAEGETPWLSVSALAEGDQGGQAVAQNQPCTGSRAQRGRSTTIRHLAKGCAVGLCSSAQRNVHQDDIIIMAQTMYPRNPLPMLVYCQARATLGSALLNTCYALLWTKHVLSAVVDD